MREASATRPRLVAFAPTDCHTCLSVNRKCQRQRPYCSTCLDRGTRCGGYATALSWHDSRAYSGQNRPSLLQGRHQGSPSTRRHKSVDSRFTSIKTASLRNWHIAQSQNSTGSSQAGSVSLQHSEIPTHVPESINDIALTYDTSVDCFPEDFANLGRAEDGINNFPLMPISQSTCSTPHSIPEVDTEQSLITFNQDQEQEQEDIPFEISALGAQPPGHINISSYDLTFDPNNPLFGDIGLCPDYIHLMFNPSANNIVNPSYLDPLQKREMLLKCYDTDLCILPLTSDLALNPFRIRGFEPESSQLLLLSILALSSQHQVNLGIGQTVEAVEHRSRASDLLARALQDRDVVNRDYCILAAILILLTLDCTISASGYWSDHIGKAAAVLEAWGGPSALKSPRIRSQVSMLVWWDATLALISRQGARFPSTYFDFLVQNEEQDGWSFYDLTGCPTELLILLIRLVEMARQKELVASMEYVTFAMNPVLDVEKELMSWTYTPENRRCGTELETQDRVQEQDRDNGTEHSNGCSPTSSDGDEEEFYQQQDRRHVAEAWRYALLLYIQRVFRWDRQSHRRPSATLRFTCSVFEHTRNCRKTSQAQKQLLLPVFLAGAEARDENMRDTARSFCLWWGARSRYGMFYSVSNLLEQFWSEPQYKDGKPTWWGSFLDEKSTFRKAGDKATQFLFG